MSKIFKQRGYNSKYPDNIVTWRYGETVPEWLSDIAKVNAINDNTNKVNLFTRDTNTGGYEILDSSGTSVLVRTVKKSDFVCKSDKIIFSLTEEQFNLLYIEESR